MTAVAEITLLSRGGIAVISDGFDAIEQHSCATEK